jgi:hypothetical protein
LLNVRGGIGNGDLAGHSVTGIREPAAEPLLVGIEDKPKHQLAAGVNDFDIRAQSGNNSESSAAACKGRAASATGPAFLPPLCHKLCRSGTSTK